MTDENQPKVTRSYATARAFREALERRLNAEAATTRTDVMRLRRQVAFDRFLARLFSAENSPWVLKGGYACELRLGHRARATKDIDLTLPHHLTTSSPSPADQIRDMLQDAAAEDLGDRFVFVVAKAKEQLVAPPYGGVRYPVTATLDERHFSNFELDVTFAAPISAPSEQLIGHDWLDFVGIAPPRVSVLPVPQQFAEKAHAYSLPHIGQENSRVKDLADMILYLETRPPDRDAVVQAVRAVFALRNTHPIPATLPEPPAAWDTVFKSIAAHCALSAADLATAYHILSVYWSSLSLP